MDEFPATVPGNSAGEASPPPAYSIVTENPAGSHARESMLINAWQVTCQNCGTSDIAGPGHPAVRSCGDGTHELHDRTALHHDHSNNCQPDPDTGHYPLDFSFMAAPAIQPGAWRRGIIGTQLLVLQALALWRLAALLTGMTDQTLVNALLSNLLRGTAAATWNPAGGTSLTITPPLHLRLFQVAGTESATGTEQTGTNGYVTGGSTLGAPSANVLASGATANTNQVQWTATGTWANGTYGIEIWDTSATPVRILWGALTSAIAPNVVVSGDTVTFAAGAITISGATW